MSLQPSEIFPETEILLSLYTWISSKQYLQMLVSWPTLLVLNFCTSPLHYYQFNNIGLVVSKYAYEKKVIKVDFFALKTKCIFDDIPGDAA